MKEFAGDVFTSAALTLNVTKVNISTCLSLSIRFCEDVTLSVRAQYPPLEIKD